MAHRPALPTTPSTPRPGASSRSGKRGSPRSRWIWTNAAGGVEELEEKVGSEAAVFESRESLERRERRTSELEQRLRERSRELDQRENDVEARKAVLEADLELREEEVERREDLLAIREERLDRPATRARCLRLPDPGEHRVAVGGGVAPLSSHLPAGMAGERIKLDVKPREEAGSAVSRRLRANGLVPGVLYGAGKQAHPFAVEERELRRVLTGEHGLHAILDVVFDGQKTAHHAVLKDYQLDPVRPRLLHIDLHEVRLDQVIQPRSPSSPSASRPASRRAAS